MTKISFDLDGVITDAEKWFFSTLDALRRTHNGEHIQEIELMYYATRQVRYNPYQFMSSSDIGYIITARKPIARQITEGWLLQHSIHLEVVYVDSNNDIDWENYEEASYESGIRKTQVLGSKGITVHFDNNPFIVKKMRDRMPSATIIQVGAEPLLRR